MPVTASQPPSHAPQGNDPSQEISSRTAAGRRCDPPHGKPDIVVSAEPGSHAPGHRHASWREQLAWWLDPRQWLRALLMLDDTPHSIALGSAIGVFISITPTFGIHMVLVMAIALLTRRLFYFNRIAALIAVYLANPLTMVPIYWFDYKVGTLFFADTVKWEQFKEMFHESTLAEWQASMKSLALIVGKPLLVGSLIVATASGLLTYPLMRALTQRMQERRRLAKLASHAAPGE
jgi:uncharacterized protein (DUF2062 family)